MSGEFDDTATTSHQAMTTNLGPIPTASAALPVLGHALQLLRRPLTFFTSLPAQGDLVRIRLGSVDAFVVCAADLTDQLLRDDRTFDKGGAFIDRLSEVMGDGVATCPHSQHRRQRRLAQPAFRHTLMPTYAQTMTAQTVSVVDGWSNGQVVDIPTQMQTITSKTLLATMFSDTPGPAVLHQMLADLNTVAASVYRRILMPPWLNRLPIPSNRRYVRARNRLHAATNGIISERRASGTDNNDLLSNLMTARESVGDHPGLSNSEIADNIVTFFIAGTETAATTLAWALHLVAENPAIEHRLHAEVDAVLAGRPANHADLSRLELTGRIITETLRLWPPAWILTRIVTIDTQLGEHIVPAGATIVYSPYIIHRRPDLYDEPERFNPDRWLSDRLAPPRGAFIGFGGGSRKCIGDTFGQTEAVLALATIAARWKLHHLPGQRVHPTAATTLRPDKLRMRAVARA